MKKVDKRLVTVMLIVLVQMLGATMILPILPLYAKNYFGLSETFITWLGTSFFGAQFLAAPWLGRLSDRFGRVPILFASQIGTMLAFLLIGLADAIWLIFAARIFDGITGGNIQVAQTYITDITPKEKRTQSLGMIFAMFGVGFALGPFLGGILSSAFGPRVPYIIASVMALIPCLMTLFFLKETLSREERIRRRREKEKFHVAKENRFSLFGVWLTTFVVQFAFGMLQSTFSLFGEAKVFPDENPKDVLRNVSYLLGMVGIGMVLTQTLVLGPMTRRFKDGTIALTGIAILMIAFAGVVLMPNPWIVGGLSLFFSLGLGLTNPSLLSLSTQAVSDSQRGSILGFHQSVASLGIIASTAVSGYLLELNVNYPFSLAAVLCLLAFILGLYLWRWWKSMHEKWLRTHQEV